MKFQDLSIKWTFLLATWKPHIFAKSLRPRHVELGLLPAMPLYGGDSAVDIGMAMGPMGHQAAYGGYLLVVNNMMVNDG